MTVKESQRIRVIDSQTGGEPTRLVVRAARTWAPVRSRNGRNAFAPNTIAFDRQW
jgi:hypothetical protein